MIPKDIILDKSMNEKRIILYSYFASKRGLDDTVGFSCDHLVEWCGFKLNYHKEKINEQLTNLINQFVSLDYMKVQNDIVRNNFNVAELNLDKFNVDAGFSLIYLNEIQKMKDFKSYTKDINKMNTSILILVLSYLRVNMLRRQDGYIGNKADKPEFCYRMYIDIEKDIGISNRYISRAIAILNELDILVSSTLPRYKDESENWHTNVTLFVNKTKYDKKGKYDSNYDYKQELIWGTEYINKKKFLSKKFYQEV